MREVMTYGHMEAGVLKVHRKKEFYENIRLLPDCRVKVIVKKLYKQRSTTTYNEDTDEWGRGQNGYYWHIVIPQFQAGYVDAYGANIDKTGAHKILKQECNYKERVNLKTGEVLKDPQSTAQLTTVEFEEYLDRCRKFIYEWFSIETPLPSEQAEIFDNTK